MGNRVITMRRARKANTGVISAMIFVGVAMGALAMTITMFAREDISAETGENKLRRAVGQNEGMRQNDHE